MEEYSIYFKIAVRFWSDKAGCAQPNGEFVGFFALKR